MNKYFLAFSLLSCISSSAFALEDYNVFVYKDNSESMIGSLIPTSKTTYSRIDDEISASKIVKKTIYQVPFEVSGSETAVIVALNRYKSALNDESGDFNEDERNNLDYVGAIVDGVFVPFSSSHFVKFNSGHYAYLMLSGLKKTSYKIDLIYIYSEPQAFRSNNVVKENESIIYSSSENGIEKDFVKIDGTKYINHKNLYENKKIIDSYFSTEKVKIASTIQPMPISTNAIDEIKQVDVFDESKLSGLTHVKSIKSKNTNSQSSSEIVKFGFVARKSGLYSYCLDGYFPSGYIDIANTEKSKNGFNCKTIVVRKPGIYEQSFKAIKNPGQKSFDYEIKLISGFYQQSFNKSIESYKAEIVRNKFDLGGNTSSNANYSPQTESY